MLSSGPKFIKSIGHLVWLLPEISENVIRDVASLIWYRVGLILTGDSNEEINVLVVGSLKTVVAAVRFEIGE